MPEHTLTVNGTARTVNVPDDMPLLWVLRDVLQLSGTKYGCGIAQCRACTIHVDGRSAFACQTPIASVGDAAVVTI